MHNSICIIPARGGSKRIPKKNIKLFHGKPIIAYSIETALMSCLFDIVMVSTDDQDIADIAIKYGAKVPFLRSAENSNDFASTSDVLIEVLGNYKNEGLNFDYACCIYPTAPFVSVKLLMDAYIKLVNGNYDCIFPVIPFSYPIQRSLKIDKDSKINMIYPEFMTSRSQDLEQTYHDSGQFYYFIPQALINGNKLFTNNTASIVINELCAHDIDNEYDWKIAELKYNFLKEEK